MCDSKWEEPTEESVRITLTSHYQVGFGEMQASVETDLPGYNVGVSTGLVLGNPINWSLGDVLGLGVLFVSMGEAVGKSIGASVVKGLGVSTTVVVGRSVGELVGKLLGESVTVNWIGDATGATSWSTTGASKE